jgi:hypothetical protein
VACTLATYDYNYQAKEGEMGSACNTYGETKNAYRLVVGRPEAKRQLGRSRCGMMDNIKKDLGKSG